MAADKYVGARANGLGRHIWTLDEAQFAGFHKVSSHRGLKLFSACPIIARMLTIAALVYSRRASANSARRHQDLGIDALPPHLRHTRIPDLDLDLGGSRGPVVDWYFPGRYFDLHTGSAQLGSNDSSPLWKQAASGSTDPDTLDCD